MTQDQIAQLIGLLVLAVNTVYTIWSHKKISDVHAATQADAVTYTLPAAAAVKQSPKSKG